MSLPILDAVRWLWWPRLPLRWWWLRPLLWLSRRLRFDAHQWSWSHLLRLRASEWWWSQRLVPSSVSIPVVVAATVAVDNIPTERPLAPRLPSHSSRTPIALPSHSSRIPIALPSHSHRIPLRFRTIPTGIRIARLFNLSMIDFPDRNSIPNRFLLLSHLLHFFCTKFMRTRSRRIFLIAARIPE